MTAVAELAPVTKSVTVPASVERAFELFTVQMGAWWPLLTHSVGGPAATGVQMQCRLGGLIVETDDDGSTHVWGTVTGWEPPQRVAFSWHPGHPVEEATTVEVGFTAEDGGTRVTLVHSGWANRADGARVRRAYLTGWDVVLARLAAGSGD